MLALIFLLISTPPILTAPASLCPTSCSCTSSGVYLNARCYSLNFLKKPLREQAKLLVTLDIHNASLTNVNANLNIFTNLRHVDLSENKIKRISASILPKSLETLDASSNSIKYLPHDIHLLPNLKKVNFKGNPLVCDCDSVSIRNALTNAGVIISQPVTCGHPKGELWQNVECKENPITLFDGMLGDASYEGSGFEDSNEKPDAAIENEFIRPVDRFGETEEINESEEGSGDDILTPVSTNASTHKDRDEVIEPIILPVGKEQLGHGVVRGCTFNCSTPSPLKLNDTDVLPAPGLFEGIKIIANDLGIIDEGKEHTTSETVPTTKSKEELRNENITMDAEIMDKTLNTDDELSSIRESSDKQSHSSFIFLAVFLLAIICLVVYVVVKKKKSARNAAMAVPNEEGKEDALEEVELLTKAIGGLEKSNGTPEAVPLINGHKNEDDGVKTTTAKEPEPKSDGDVQLRKQFDDKNTLTPEAKRVTIKAGEIPNSTPKTPILVVRRKNSDGSIVTTPEFDQRL